MKRILSILVGVSLLISGFVQKPVESRYGQKTVGGYSSDSLNQDQAFCEDLYAAIESQLDSDDYEINDISTIYLSKEYIEEKIFNSQSNVYFGYTLPEIEWSFEGDRFVFAPDGEGHTIVKEFEPYEDPFEQIFKDICFGTGVILVCVTASVFSGALGMTSACVVFAYAAETAVKTAFSYAVVGSFISGAISAYKTQDFDEVMKSMAIGASRGYKIGAVIGAVSGGVKALKTIRYMKNTIPSPREAELIAQAQYSGEEQVSFLNGEVVSGNPVGASRPDIVRVVDGHLEAIEVKRYDLENHLDDLVEVLEKQVGSRIVNLPEGSTQRIVLDVQGRGYSQAFLEDVVDTIQWDLYDIYPDIPVDIQGWIP